MTARSVIEHALRAYYAESAEPNAIAHDLLAQYDAERDEEKATAPAATATPGEPTGRVAALLNEIRRQRGSWTITRAVRFYRNDGRQHTGYMPNTELRNVARGDLRDLAAWGHLDYVDTPGKQFYKLTTQGDRRS